MFEAYKVAVRLSLVSNVGAGLAILSSQFARLNGDTKRAQSSIADLEKSLNNIKRLGLVGGAMAGVGFGALSLFRAPLEAAKEYETAHARFKTLNLGEEVNKQADAFARGTQAFGASSTQLMETLRESIGMFGDIGIAKQVAPLLAELNAANSAMFQGKVAGIDEGAVRAIMRFNDMRGLTNTATDFKRGLDLAQKLVTGSGGALKFTDLEQLAKRGGAAFKGLSDDGVMMLATVMQEQGGSATGTALMSLYQNLVAGRTTKKAMAMLSQSGLAELGYVEHGTVGGKPYKTMQVTGIKGEELLRTNPGQWLMTYGVDAAKKSGAKTDSEVIAFMNNLISNRTGSNLAATFTTQSLQAMRDFKLVSGAMGAQQTIGTFKDTTQGRLVEMQAKWNKVLSELGSTILPIAIRAAEGLTTVIKGAIKFAQEFPTLTKGLTIALGVLAGLVAVGGTVMLASAAFQALGLALAFSAVGGVAGLAALAAPILGIAAALGIFSGAAYGLYKIFGGGKEESPEQKQRKADNAKSYWSAMDGAGNDLKNGTFLSGLFGEKPAGNPVELALPSARWELSKNPSILPVVQQSHGKEKPLLPVVQQAQNQIEKKKADLGVFAGAQNAPNVLPPSTVSMPASSPYIRPKSARPIEVTVISKLDEREVARSVVKVATREASRPISGTSIFDRTMSPMPIGFPA